MYTSMNQASNGGDFIKTEGDFNANMDYTRKGHTMYIQGPIAASLLLHLRCSN